MRAMLLEFPDDPACDTLDRPYLLGESLLVAPVFSRDNVVEYYVPEGRWTKFLTGELAEGPRWVREPHGFLSVPLLVRPNTVLPVGAREDRPDYDFADGVTFQVYQLKDSRSVVANIPALDGTAGDPHRGDERHQAVAPAARRGLGGGRRDQGHGRAGRKRPAGDARHSRQLADDPVAGGSVNQPASGFSQKIAAP